MIGTGWFSKHRLWTTWEAPAPESAEVDVNIAGLWVLRRLDKSELLGWLQQSAFHLSPVDTGKVEQWCGLHWKRNKYPNHFRRSRRG